MPADSRQAIGAVNRTYNTYCFKEVPTTQEEYRRRVIIMSEDVPARVAGRNTMWGTARPTAAEMWVHIDHTLAMLGLV